MNVKIYLKKQDVIEMFGSGAAAGRAIGVSKVWANKWGEYVPELAAWCFVALYPTLPHVIEKKLNQAAA